MSAEGPYYHEYDPDFRAAVDGSPVAKLSCEAATEENAKRRSFMPRTQVTGKASNGTDSENLLETGAVTVHYVLETA